MPSLFLEVVAKLAPLYLWIVLGALAARFLHLRPEPFGVLLIYILSPALVFFTFWGTSISRAESFLPLVLFLLCVTVGLLTRAFTWRKLSAPARGLLSFACASGNTGYFGIPVSLVLFGPESLPLAVLSAFGFILFENTFGFYWANRGRYSWKESLWRVLRLPALYALLLGAAAHQFQVPYPAVWREFSVSVRGAYSVLGILLVGMGLGSLSSMRIDWKFVGTAVGLKLILWPVVVAAFLVFDTAWLHVFPADIHRQMRLVSFVPLPAVSVAFAAILKIHPEDTALAVFLSTVLGLFVVTAALVFGFVR